MQQTKKHVSLDHIPFIFFGIVSFVVFLLFQARGVFGGDSGDLVTAAVTGGVAHPPGYPLYTFLGFLLSRIPLFTPAWWVGLLSSIPSACVIGFVSYLVFRFTKKLWAAVFSGVLLLGNNLFFLYSVTTEVFALFDFFIIFLIFLVFAWRETKKSHWLLAAGFLFGLSLTHHHMIVFLTPALAWFIWRNRSLIPKKKTQGIAIKSIALCLLGFLPYAYVIVAAHGNSVINWDRPVDFAGFWHLFTRADYGTFVSGGLYGTALAQRFLQIQAYIQYLFYDFTWAGVGLIVLGMVSVWKRDRTVFWFLILALICLGPGFLFYASFPLANRFTLATYERFLLPTYVLYSIVIGVGIAYAVELLRRTLAVRISQVTLRWVIGAFITILFMLPLLRLGMTGWRFFGLPGDQTANNVGLDILSPLPKGSVLLLGRDTALFSTQYVRYGLGVRPDVAVVHTSRLGSPDYQITLTKAFPAVFPAGSSSLTVTALAQRLYPATRIFSNTAINIGDGWIWVPRGLTYELIDEAKAPPIEGVQKVNATIWATLHDPLNGILSRYNHLMLSDVRDIYAGGHIALGTALLRAGATQDAKVEFEKAIMLDADTELDSAYTYLGLADLALENCQEALTAFDLAANISVIPDKNIMYYKSITYRDCVGDATAAASLRLEYEALRRKEELPLQK